MLVPTLFLNGDEVCDQDNEEVVSSKCVHTLAEVKDFKLETGVG